MAADGQHPPVGEGDEFLDPGELCHRGRAAQDHFRAPLALPSFHDDANRIPLIAHALAGIVRLLDNTCGSGVDFRSALALANDPYAKVRIVPASKAKMCEKAEFTRE